MSKTQNQPEEGARGKQKESSASNKLPEMENIAYTEAYEELKTILETIESGEISLDELSEKVNRAAILLEICKAKLQKTEVDVSKILEKFE